MQTVMYQKRYRIVLTKKEFQNYQYIQLIFSSKNMIDGYTDHPSASYCAGKYLDNYLITFVKQNLWDVTL